jgi:hypothetical protein
MRCAAFEARMQAPFGKEGTVSTRHALESAATRGVASAIAELAAEPEVPDSCWYLWDRFRVLNGMRSEGVHAIAPFTPEMIRAADRLFGWRLEPFEVDALVAMDTAYRNPKVVEERT